MKKSLKKKFVNKKKNRKSNNKTHVQRNNIVQFHVVTHADDFAHCLGRCVRFENVMYVIFEMGRVVFAYLRDRRILDIVARRFDARSQIFLY